ncbi:zinc-finger domain-containing protein [Phaeovibrio sulfidiphilus]|uniref:Zinc-finger domain-containing protein n=1 Tax=Phaeovibrio sulfidiphilus TaxID=1220600 RepID=A0A8J6YNQ4_9PROT|nr:zinc-finger domain-containing protein [Phaeovibrio sulfidiphilus]MBE1237925.1 zinc-finger domain-containing protein [Phaeovibrio sulfidiphilus]
MTHHSSVRILETRRVNRLVVCCDGGHPVLGHPRVFLKIPPACQEVVCPYCSCRFVFDAREEQSVLPVSGRAAQGFVTAS